MRSEIKIIVWSSALAVLSLGYLTWSGSLALDPGNQPGVWTLSFCNPADASLDFRLSNFGSDPQFRWKLVDADGNVAAQADIQVRPGESFEIRVQPAAGSLSGRMSVIVTNHDGQKLISKSF